jgi:hypothetical protein
LLFKKRAICCWCDEFKGKRVVPLFIYTLIHRLCGELTFSVCAQPIRNSSNKSNDILLLSY